MSEDHSIPSVDVKSIEVDQTRLAIRMNVEMIQGPNVRRLIVARMAQLAVPNDGGLKDAIEFWTTPNRIGDTAKEATEWVEEVIKAVKLAPNNPYGDDDEAIAGEILRRLDEKKKYKYNRK